MDVDELRRQQEAARAFMEEEGRRLSEATRPGEGTGRRGQRYRNADGDGEEDGDAESEPDKKRRLLETLRQDFPSLNHWPDSYILQQSASGLTKAHAEMENRSGRGGRPSLETRMARNFKISNGRKIQLPAGEDDRATVIHEGRFLPGLLCTIGETFRAAKGVLPERGHDPVAHYDARGLGLGYLVSAKAWAAVHDPGCTDINLGMFTHAAGAAGTRITTPSSSARTWTSLSRPYPTQGRCSSWSPPGTTPSLRSTSTWRTSNGATAISQTKKTTSKV